MDHVEELKTFARTKEFFIGIDSDGCAFDTMEPKHKACFYPMLVEHWNLAGVARCARDVWDFVNLYSRTRGCNRFLAVLRTFELLDDWDEVKQSGYIVPDISSLRTWTREETKLGNPTLQTKVTATNDPILAQALRWSQGVNEQVARSIHDVPPFAHVKKCLEKIAPKADVMVVSATPHEALAREWKEHGIDGFAGKICGQEQGLKKEHLQYGAAGKYDADNILMIGDAPGDLKAAKDNNALFYPINPGREAASWKRFYEEGAEKFFGGAFAGDYEQRLIDEFLVYLPETPPWKQ